MKKADLFFNVLRLPMDFAMLLLAGVFTYLMRTELLSSIRPVLFEFNLPLVRYFYIVLAVSFIFLGAYAISGLYSMKTRIGRGEEFSKILVASSAGVMVIIVYIFLKQELFNSRFLVLGAWFIAVLFVSIGRQIIRFIQIYSVSKYNFGTHKLLLIGGDTVANAIYDEISNDISSGYRIVGHIPSPEISQISKINNQEDLDEVILADPNYPAEKITSLVDYCHENHIIFKFVPNIYQTLTSNFDIDIIDQYPMIELKRTPLDGWGKVIKRLIDIMTGIFGLIILSPVFGIIAFAIKWETAGPVFVRLKRVSKNKGFSLYKFRGMIATDPDGSSDSLKEILRQYNERKDGPLFKMSQDPRLTKVGRFIRKYRLDELPQFWNILKGEMSLIGPRPHQPDEISQYEKTHKKVLAIKAGATGLAQISGSSDLSFNEEVSIDSFYIENWSLALDIKIIFKTMTKMIKDRSAV